MERLIIDNEVAVAVSPGYGAGWSTWEDVHPENKEVAMFLYHEDKEGLIKWCDDREIYTGSVEDLVLMWIPIGTKYIIDEYDGAEMLMTIDDYNWITAGED